MHNTICEVSKSATKYQPKYELIRQRACIDHTGIEETHNYNCHGN